eukprot:c2255_g2_i1 orf=51-299(+)
MIMGQYSWGHDGKVRCFGTHRDVLEELPSSDVISWRDLIIVMYKVVMESTHGNWFECMQLEACLNNEVTSTCGLKVYGIIGL